MFGRSDEASLHIRVCKLICKVSSRPFVCGCGPVTCSVLSAPGHEISSDIHFQEYLEAHCSLSHSHSTWVCSSALSLSLSLWCPVFLPYFLSIDCLLLWMSEVQYHCGYKPLYLSPFSSACLVLLCNAGNLVWFPDGCREPGHWWMIKGYVFLHSCWSHLKCKACIHSRIKMRKWIVWKYPVRWTKSLPCHDQ